MARSIRGWCFFEGALGRPASEQGGAPSMAPSATFADAVTDQQELRRLALEGLPRLQHSQEVTSAIARSASVRTLFGIHDPRAGHTPSPPGGLDPSTTGVAPRPPWKRR
jgi:hypothetical protein